MYALRLPGVRVHAVPRKGLPDLEFPFFRDGCGAMTMR